MLFDLPDSWMQEFLLRKVKYRSGEKYRMDSIVFVSLMGTAALSGLYLVVSLENSVSVHRKWGREEWIEVGHR